MDNLYKTICLAGIIFIILFGDLNSTFAQQEPPSIMQEDQAAKLLFLNQKNQADCTTKGGEWDGTKCNEPKNLPATCVGAKEMPCKINKSCSWNIASKICEQANEVGLYTTLEAIYEGGVGLTQSLLSKLGTSEYKVIVDIPCDNAITKIIGGADCNATKDYQKSIPLYVARLYQFSFAIVGVVALLMMIYGAAQYTLSAGGLSTEDAKEIITQAIYGLLLLFGAYLILYTINPGLVSIKAPSLNPINASTFLKPTTTQAPVKIGNTPTETSGTNIANCKVSTPPPTVICTECNVGYEFITSSKKCEPCGSGWTYSSSKKACMDCSSAAQDTITLKIKPGDVLTYYPNALKDCSGNFKAPTLETIPKL